MRTLLQDIKYGFRQLRQRPAFSIVVVLVLALGIGANTAIFNLVYAVLLRPLPVNNPQELVLLTPEGFYPGGSMRSYSSHSYPMYEFLKEHNEVFSGLLCRCQFDANVGLQGQTHRIKAEMVSGDYFSTLGIRSVLGRLITPDDNVRPGEHPVAVLSDSYWESQFGRDPEAAGAARRLRCLRAAFGDDRRIVAKKQLLHRERIIGGAGYTEIGFAALGL